MQNHTSIVPVTSGGRMPALFKDRVFLILAVSALALLLILAVMGARQVLAAQGESSKTVSVHGLILDSEMGAVLEADNGDVYFLEGPDMSAHYDTLATVTGVLTLDEGGNRYIDVTGVAPDLESPSPTPAPAGGEADPLNMKDETGLS